MPDALAASWLGVRLASTIILLAISFTYWRGGARATSRSGASAGIDTRGRALETGAEASPNTASPADPARFARARVLPNRRRRASSAGAANICALGARSASAALQQAAEDEQEDEVASGVLEMLSSTSAAPVATASNAAAAVDAAASSPARASRDPTSPAHPTSRAHRAHVEAPHDAAAQAAAAAQERDDRGVDHGFDLGLEEETPPRGHGRHDHPAQHGGAAAVVARKGGGVPRASPLAATKLLFTGRE